MSLRPAYHLCLTCPHPLTPLFLSLKYIGKREKEYGVNGCNGDKTSQASKGDVRVSRTVFMKENVFIINHCVCQTVKSVAFDRHNDYKHCERKGANRCW